MSVAHRLVGLIMRGVLKKLTETAVGVPKLRVQLWEGDDPQNVPLLQDYGLQSRPKPGAQPVVIAINGDPDNLGAIAVADRRYTIAMAHGEVALVDDLGQKVHLTRNGIVVDAPSIKFGASATKDVGRKDDPVKHTANFATWIGNVEAALNLAGSAISTPWSSYATDETGVIKSGSTIVRSE